MARPGNPPVGCHGDRPRPRRRRATEVRRRPLWRLQVHPGEQDETAYLGWGVDHEEDLDLVQKALADLGVASERGDAELAEARAVNRILVFSDPWGFRHEVTWGQSHVRSSFAPDAAHLGFRHRAAGPGPRAAAHARHRGGARVLHQARVPAVRQDHRPGRLNARFYHCNARHHTLALGQCPPGVAGLNHLMIQVGAIDDVGTGYEIAQEIGVPLTLTLGRHSNDQQFSFYHSTPSSLPRGSRLGGLEVEEETWVPRVFDRTAVWGHKPHPDGKGRRPASCTHCRMPRPPSRTGPDRTVSTVPAPFAAAEALVGVGPAPTPTQRRERLRALLSSGTLVLPGVTDALGARLVERAGFDAAYLTSTASRTARHPRRRPAVPRRGRRPRRPDHVGDHPAPGRRRRHRFRRPGHGHAGRPAPRAGGRRRAAAQGPRRCPSGADTSTSTLSSRPRTCRPSSSPCAALDDPATVVIARTDARSVHGIDEAIRRGQAYADAGADVLFVEAPRTVGELERVGRELRGIPLVVNVVEGGKTPQLAWRSTASWASASCCSPTSSCAR